MVGVQGLNTSDRLSYSQFLKMGTNITPSDHKGPKEVRSATMELGEGINKVAMRKGED